MSTPDPPFDAADSNRAKPAAKEAIKDAGQSDAEGAAGEYPPAVEKPLRELRKLVRKYTKRLRKNLRLACAGDEEGVHDLRVATRRLQALIELLDPQRRDKKTNQLRKRLKAVRHAVGEERDLRLFAQSAQRRASRAASPARRRVWREIAADLAAEFTRASQRAHTRLQRRSAAALAGKIKRAVRKKRSIIDAAQIASSIEQARAKLGASIRKAETSHAASGYHDVRIKTKSLRYLLEVRAKASASTCDDTLINLLKSAQDELGDWHDEVELCRRATIALSTDADRQADAGATEVLEAMRRRSSAINQHAREVAGGLRDVLGLDGPSARLAPAHRRAPREKDNRHAP